MCQLDSREVEVEAEALRPPVLVHIGQLEQEGVVVAVVVEGEAPPLQVLALEQQQGREWDDWC